MSLSNNMENSLALLIFNNTNVTNIGDATGIRGSLAAGNLYVALHTADPSETGNQSTNECSYTGYSRIPIPRNSSGWTVTNNTASNTSLITFGMNQSGNTTITHVSVGLESSGVTNILAYGTLSSSFICTTGTSPTFAIGQLVITFD